MPAQRRKMKIADPERPIGWGRPGLSVGQAVRALALVGLAALV
ncbi:MAG: hypothetical protein JWN93_1138, partial [Hyphomicrobiales bacterium]|nr:hypothetical protein [Hyphomicrobiales bacterium]